MQSKFPLTLQWWIISLNVGFCCCSSSFFFKQLDFFYQRVLSNKQFKLKEDDVWSEAEAGFLIEKKEFSVVKGDRRGFTDAG